MNIRPQYHFRDSDQGLLAWDVIRLCQLAATLTPKTIPLDAIRELDEAYWYDLGGAIPTCRNIIEHLQLINSVDLRYPIILDCHGRVMDGMHRTCRAVIDGHETILAVQFTQEVLPDFVGVDPSDLP